MPAITATRTHGTVDSPEPLEAPVITEDENGWDTLRQKFLIESTTQFLQANLTAYLPKGWQHPDFTGFRLVDRSPSEGYGNLWEVDCTFRGFLTPTRYKRTTTSVIEEGPGEPRTASQGGIVRYAKSRPQCTTIYLSTTLPDVSKLSLRVDDDNPLPEGYPALPGDITPTDSEIPVGRSEADDTVTQGTLTFYYGWVLEKREWDELRDEQNETVLYLVTDVHTVREWSVFTADE